MNVEGIIAGDINAWAEVAGVADAQAHRPHCPTCRCNQPVCDFCDQPVVVDAEMGYWRHQNGLFGCDVYHTTHAQVNGTDRP